MKNSRGRVLIERVARNAGVPESLIRDIVPLAQRHLEATGRGTSPLQRDVVWAVERARREWSQRFLARLEARRSRVGVA